MKIFFFLSSFFPAPAISPSVALYFFSDVVYSKKEFGIFFPQHLKLKER